MGNGQMESAQLGAGSLTKQPQMADLQGRLQESLDMAHKLYSDVEAANARMFGEQPQCADESATSAPCAPGQIGELMALADSLRGMMGNLAGSLNRLCSLV